MKFKQKNLLILFATLVIMMLGFGMIIPILPFYVQAMGANGRDLGLLMAIYGLMQLVFAPFWGSLSDRIGRKPILLLGILGNVISQILMGVATQLWVLFVARALAGILSSATFPTAMAFISDSTSEEDRGKGMGAIGAAMGLGMILGPGLGGWLAKGNLSLPFFVAAGLSATVFVLVHLILPESLAPEKRVQDRGKFRGPQFKQMWQSLFGPLGFLMFLSFLLSFGLAGFESIFGLYSAQRYGFGPGQVGTVMVFIGVASVLVQGGLIGPLIKKLGENRVIQMALLISGIGFFLLLTANNFGLVLATTSFFAMGNAFLSPSVAALISRRSHGAEQGMSLGLHNSFLSLGRVAGPISAGFLFDVNLSLPYISGGIVMLMGLLATLIWLTGDPRIQKPVYMAE